MIHYVFKFIDMQDAERKLGRKQTDTLDSDITHPYGWPIHFITDHAVIDMSDPNAPVETHPQQELPGVFWFIPNINEQQERTYSNHVNLYGIIEYKDTQYIWTLSRIPDTDMDKVVLISPPPAGMTQLRNIPINTTYMIDHMKDNAAARIDLWRKSQQDSGYLFPTNNVIYGTTPSIQILLLGKLKDIELDSQTDSWVFPSIDGAPVVHTAQQLEDIAVGVARKLEYDYLAAVSLTGQLYHHSIDSEESIEQLLTTVTGGV